jgi:hypothetical protein
VPCIRHLPVVKLLRYVGDGLAGPSVATINVIYNGAIQHTSYFFFTVWDFDQDGVRCDTFHFISFRTNYGRGSSPYVLPGPNDPL